MTDRCWSCSRISTARCLDHQTYSFEAAPSRSRASEQAACRSCSARARRAWRLNAIRQRLNSFHPFVSENGAAVFIPPGYFPFAVPGARERDGYRVLEYGRPIPGGRRSASPHGGPAVDVPWSASATCRCSRWRRSAGSRCSTTRAWPSSRVRRAVPRGRRRSAVARSAAVAPCAARASDASRAAASIT